MHLREIMNEKQENAKKIKLNHVQNAKSQTSSEEHSLIKGSRAARLIAPVISTNTVHATFYLFAMVMAD